MATPSRSALLRVLFVGFGITAVVCTALLFSRTPEPKSSATPVSSGAIPGVSAERIAQARAGLARGILREAERQLEAGEYEKAADLFRRSRRVQPEPLATWIGEIKALRALHRDTDARAVAQKLRQERPEAARDAEAGPLLRELASP